MVANLPFNPMATTVASGTFSIATTGYIQGTMLDDPAIRNELAGGVLLNTETLPMWGGVGITEQTPANTPFVTELGGYIGRATALTGSTSLTGFSVFNQAHAMINTPQSPVPLAGSGMTVSYFRLGSGARIAVAVDPALISLQGTIITSQVSWDFGAQRLCPFVAAYPANVITAASWTNTAGGTATLTTTTAHGLSVGSDFTITGVTPAAYNGTFTAITGTTGSTIVYLLPALTTPGAGTAFGTLVAGGGALNVRTLDVSVGTSMTVTYNPTTGFATWNRSGSTAIILI